MPPSGIKLGQKMLHNSHIHCDSLELLSYQNLDMFWNNGSLTMANKNKDFNKFNKVKDQFLFHILCLKVKYYYTCQIPRRSASIMKCCNFLFLFFLDTCYANAHEFSMHVYYTEVHKIKIPSKSTQVIPPLLI